MVMQKFKSRASSSKALTVDVGDATSCSSTQISWDASSGKAPWTIMIAPINETPITISIPEASGSNAQYNWSIPNYGSATTTFVGISDSTGQVSGVSSAFTIGTSKSTCTGPSVALDFIWYPTANTAGADLPAQCSDWGITWATETSNSGIDGKVTFTFLPEKGTPLTVSTSSGKTTTNGGNFDFTIPWDAGTKFAAIANDGGKSGTGGVGDLYTVTSGKSSCSSGTNIGNGLPSAQTTGAIVATTSTAKSSKATSAQVGQTTSPGIPVFTQGSSAKDGTSSSTSSHVGAAVGGTLAALAAVVILLGLLWYMKKKSRGQEENPFEKSAGAGAAAPSRMSTNEHGISPWRWSTSPYEGPVTNSRRSKWLGKAASLAPTKGFRVLGERDNGHTSTNSISTSVQGPFTSAHARNTSSISKSASDSFGSPTSPRQQPTTFRNVVPDHALFPPPKPVFYDERNLRGPYAAEEHAGGASLAGQGTFDSMVKQDSMSQSSNTSPQDSTFNVPRRKPMGLTSNADTMPNLDYNGYSNQNLYNNHPQVGRLWQDGDGLTHEVQLGMEQPPLVTSEVMMHNLDRRSHHSLEGGLPYL